MEMNELYSYSKYCLFTFSVSTTLYSTILAGSMIYDIFSDNKIRSEKELGNIVKEESKKLGLNDSEIKINFSDKEGHFAISELNFINIQRGKLDTTKNTVRHELYHLFKKHKPHNNKVINLITKISHEFQALTYENFGIKI